MFQTRFLQYPRVVTPPPSEIVCRLKQENSRLALACNVYKKNETYHLARIAGLQGVVDKLQASITQLQYERQHKQYLFDAADLIDMFGFYAHGAEWKRICRSVSKSSNKATKNQYVTKIETALSGVSPTIDVASLREISKLRNKYAHRNLASITEQRKFLDEMETRVWSKKFQVLSPCIAYLRLQTLKKKI